MWIYKRIIFRLFLVWDLFYLRSALHVNHLYLLHLRLVAVGVVAFLDLHKYVLHNALQWSCHRHPSTVGHEFVQP